MSNLCVRNVLICMVLSNVQSIWIYMTPCIKDYGPVYSFWCFAFERMNGILSSFHVNDHHISIQLTQRFLNSKKYAPINWPAEYLDEYFPFLNHFSYNKGSLLQENIESEITSDTHVHHYHLYWSMFCNLMNRMICIQSLIRS